MLNLVLESENIEEEDEDQKPPQSMLQYQSTQASKEANESVRLSTKHSLANYASTENQKSPLNFHTGRLQLL